VQIVLDDLSDKQYNEIYNAREGYKVDIVSELPPADTMCVISRTRLRSVARL
jgi:hypothetical protein